MNLRILEDAEREIAQARDYLEGKVRSFGMRFLNELAETLSDIEQQPLRFQKLETLPDSETYRRALLSVFRYAVVFEILAEEILIVAICHTSREPNYWLSRRNR